MDIESSSTEQEDSGSLREPNWQQLEGEQQSPDTAILSNNRTSPGDTVYEPQSDAKILAVYEEPQVDVGHSADAAIDVEVAKRKVDAVFDKLQQAEEDRETINSHPDEPDIRRAFYAAETEEYNDKATNLRIESLHSLDPGESTQIMTFPSETPEGFDSSDGLKEMAMFFDKAGIDGIDLPELGSKSSHETNDGLFDVTISTDKGPDGTEMITVTAQRTKQDASTGK